MHRIEKGPRRSAGHHRLPGLMLAAGALFAAVEPAVARDVAPTSLEQWLLRRLNDPTERERAHEREGNVYIYDGLSDRDVNHALSRNFDRIEYMMFVGTRKTDAARSPRDGDADEQTESPGCGD